MRDAGWGCGARPRGLWTEEAGEALRLLQVWFLQDILGGKHGWSTGEGASGRGAGSSRNRARSCEVSMASVRSFLGYLSEWDGVWWEWVGEFDLMQLRFFKRSFFSVESRGQEWKSGGRLGGVCAVIQAREMVVWTRAAAVGRLQEVVSCRWKGAG